MLEIISLVGSVRQNEIGCEWGKGGIKYTRDHNKTNKETRTTKL